MPKRRSEVGRVVDFFKNTDLPTTEAIFSLVREIMRERRGPKVSPAKTRKTRKVLTATEVNLAQGGA